MSAASRRAFLAAAGGAGAALAAAGAVTGAVAGAVAAAEAPEVALMATYVAGAGRHCGRAAFERLEPGARLALRREPENGYDALAVAVWTTGGDKLGYVPRIHNQALANLMDAGLRPVARVAGVSAGGARPGLALDIRLALGR